jgi:hypothetical protein
MKKIAVVLAATGLLALAACGKTPANESANASNVTVEHTVENAAEPTANAVETNAAEATGNAANAE